MTATPLSPIKDFQLQRLAYATASRSAADNSHISYRHNGASQVIMTV